MIVINFALCDIKDQQNVSVYSRVRFVLRNDVCAVWQPDDDGTLTRLDHQEVVTFSRRRSARNPHVLTLSDGAVWNIFPLKAGCGCGSKSVSYSYDQLLSPDLVTL